MAVTVQTAVHTVPSPRQLKWQEMEFYAFIHFGMNTFTGREWGLGNEDPSLFKPEGLDASQWVEVCKAAGMTGIILTCKHHDGFCLWPSDYTDYSVKASPWRNGRGDVVRELAEACREHGLKLGIYLSPWDRHEPSYGDSPAYNAYFLNQLRELLTNYGELFCVWFDGACGEGSNGMVQEYDWDAYYRVIRELQPDAVISICGPDVRWCGNEIGHTRKSEWSVVPETMKDNEIIQAKSQKKDDGTFSQRVDTTDEDLGSRTVLAQIDHVIWYPAEVDVSIRPRWFYHADDDERVKSVDELINLYESAVGGNSGLLLNIPPDRRGVIHENDARNLREFGQWLRSTYGNDLASKANVRASCTRDAVVDVMHVVDGRTDTFWCPPAGMEKAELEFDLGEAYVFNRIVLQEHLPSGQRIERFQLEYWQGERWLHLYEGTVVGYKRICRLPQTKARYLRLNITDSRINPTLSGFGVYFSGR